MKMLNKRILKKILIILTLFILLTEMSMQSVNIGVFVNSSNVAYAENADDALEEFNKVLDIVVGTIQTIVGGIVGIITYPYRIYGLGLGLALQTIGDSVAGVAGRSDHDLAKLFTPESIFFNRYNITNIDFFSSKTDDMSIMGSIRDNIALWYYVMRNIAIVILLGILIYVGIRMAISTVASDRAVYKKMLIDWATSLALIFVLHFIIIATIKVNNSFVEMMENISKNSLGFSKAATDLLLLSTSINFFTGFGAMIVYIAMQIITFIFLLTYIKRMLTIAFLIIIAPLITITYSIDKMGDQKAQALNTWLKEFMLNVLIQPFHCIIYLAFADIAIGAITGGSEGFLAWMGFNSSLGGVVLSLVALKFMFDGEKIVKKIFGFDKASFMANPIASAAMLATAGKQIANLGGKASEAAGKANKYIGTGAKSSRIRDGLNKTKIGSSLTKKADKLGDSLKEKSHDRKENKIRKYASEYAAKTGKDVNSEEVRKKAEEKYEKRKAMTNNFVKKGVSGTTAGLVGLTTYMASEDESGLFAAGTLAKATYSKTNKTVNDWQKRKKRSFENDMVGNFTAYAKANHQNYDLSTNEGMTNLIKYADMVNRLGKDGDEFSSERNAKVSEKMEKALDGHMTDSDISRLKGDLAHALNDENAGTFDIDKFYKDNIEQRFGQGEDGLRKEEFIAAVLPFINQQLMANMFGYQEQFDDLMSSSGKNYEDAVQGINDNRARYNLDETHESSSRRTMEEVVENIEETRNTEEVVEESKPTDQQGSKQQGTTLPETNIPPQKKDNPIDSQIKKAVSQIQDGNKDFETISEKMLENMRIAVDEAKTALDPKKAQEILTQFYSLGGRSAPDKVSRMIGNSEAEKNYAQALASQQKTMNFLSKKYGASKRIENIVNNTTVENTTTNVHNKTVNTTEIHQESNNPRGSYSNETRPNGNSGGPKTN